MNNYKNIAFFFIVCLLCQSCYKELTLDLSQEENQIVINALFNNTEPMSATVTKSFIFYEDVKIEALKNAEVAIYENDIFKENMVYQKTPAMDIGEFTASFYPKMEANYRIEASNDGLSSASASGVMPTGVDITNASVKYGGDNAYAFDFKLNDLPEKNYYYLKMFFQGYEIDSITQERIDRGPFVVEIPESAIPNKAERYIRNGFIFKDDGLNGQAIIISGIAKSGEAYLSAATFPGESRAHLRNIILDTSMLYIHLQTLTEDVYKFYSSNATPIQNDSDRLAESSTVYGNVEGGLGLFSGIYISEVGAVVEQ